MSVGEAICHVSVGDLMVGIESQMDCILASIKSPDGTDNVPSDNVIALCVDNKEEYTKFLELQLKAALAQNTAQVIASNSAAANASANATAKPVATPPVAEAAAILKKAEVKDLLKELKFLINNKKIEEESDFTKKLLSLARKGNKELLDVFEASFEEGTTSYADQTKFDANFFLDNAVDIVNEFSEK